jgi:hypothetical protein
MTSFRKTAPDEFCLLCSEPKVDGDASAIFRKTAPDELSFYVVNLKSMVMHRLFVMFNCYKQASKVDDSAVLMSSVDVWADNTYRPSFLFLVLPIRYRFSLCYPS